MITNVEPQAPVWPSLDMQCLSLPSAPNAPRRWLELPSFRWTSWYILIRPCRCIVACCRARGHSPNMYSASSRRSTLRLGEMECFGAEMLKSATWTDHVLLLPCSHMRLRARLEPSHFLPTPAAARSVSFNRHFSSVFCYHHHHHHVHLLPERDFTV